MSMTERRISLAIFRVWLGWQVMKPLAASAFTLAFMRPILYGDLPIRPGTVLQTLKYKYECSFFIRDINLGPRTLPMISGPLPGKGLV